jgi:hypothetical protein
MVPATAGPSGSSRPPATSTSTPSTGVSSSGAPIGVVVDLRSVPEVSPATAVAPAAEVEAMVFASIAGAAEDDFVVTLEGEPRRPANLFEPSGGAAAPGGHHAAIRDLAVGARAASRAMRPGVPPSPFFTPGAVVPTSESA